MKHDMRNLEIAKSYISIFPKPNLNYQDVCVPQEIIKECKDKMKKYREDLEQYRHASLGSKVSRFLYGEDDESAPGYEKEEGRRKKLQNTFDEMAVWLGQVQKTFEGCKGSEKIKKYMDELKKDFNKLSNNKGKGKGYITWVTNTAQRKISNDPKTKFDKTAYALKNNPILPFAQYTGVYGEQLESTYNCFYAQLYELLFHYDEKFKLRVDLAEAAQNNVTDYIEQIVIIAENCLNKSNEAYQKLVDELNEKYDKLDSPSLRREKDRIIKEYLEGSDELSDAVDKIKKINMNAKFADYFKTLDITENMKNIQAYNKSLRGFYKNATSDNAKFNDLKVNYDFLCKEYVKMLPILKAISHPQSEFIYTEKNINTRNEITTRIVKYEERAEQKLNEIQTKQKEFGKALETLNDKFEQYKTAKTEYSKRKKYYYAFVALALISTVFSNLTPLLNAVAAKPPAPVAGAPQG